jgi:GNAT superfamily N-acetyltransferase
MLRELISGDALLLSGPYAQAGFSNQDFNKPPGFRPRNSPGESRYPRRGTVPLPSLWIDPEFRGHKIGHAVLKAILGTVGRATALVILQASPVLTDGGPEEGSQEYTAVNEALRRYRANFGFQGAAGDYLVLGTLVDAFDD